MKKIKNILLAAVTGMVTLASCTDLTETPYAIITEENLEFNDKDIEDLAGKVYQNLRKAFDFNGLVAINDEAGDLYAIPLRLGVGWGDFYIAFHKHEFNQSIHHLWVAWDACYGGILYANKCLDMPKVQENKTLSAELRAMRALFYYILFDLFRNVPLITTLDNPAGYMPEQASPQETFDFIVNELNAIIPDLGTDKPHGYPNEYMARMILAKMYLNHNAWFNDFSSNEYYEKAIVEADAVISSGKYELEDEYLTSFKSDNSISKEVIFSVPFSGLYATGNALSLKFMIQEGLKAFGCTGTASNGGVALPQFIDTYDPDDKRFDDTWAHGQQYDYYTGEKLRTNADDQGVVDLVYTKDVHSIDNPGAYMLEGYRFKKYEITPDSYGTYGTDICFFRLADAMFIKAECLLRIGRDKQTAADLITEVRKRAFRDHPEKAVRTIADLEAGSVYDYGHREYTSRGATNYDPNSYVATYEGGDDIELGGLLDDLAWEFVGEQHRRQDLIRFHLTSKKSNVWNGKSWFCKDAESDPTDMNKNLFPIYVDFLNGNNELIQNPGYER